MLGIGLAMSIPLVVFGSQLILMLMDRFPIIIYAGAAILGWTAAKMVVADTQMGTWLLPYSLLLEVVMTVGVVAVGYWLKTRRAEPVHQPE